MDRQCHRMSNLLDTCSEISRLATARNDTVLEVFDLGKVLERSVRRAREQDEDRGWTIDLEPAASEVTIWFEADVRAFGQMVRHSLSYVQRSSPQSRSIRVSRRVSEPHLDLVLATEPPEPTGPAGSTPTPGAELDRCRAGSLAEQLGGQMDLGPPLILRLPLGSVETRPGPRVNAPVSAGRRPILIVDDEPDTVRPLGVLLSRIGWRVRVTSDIAEAMGLVRAFCPEVLLIDFHMPETDGASLARLIRRECPTAAPLLIGITGSEDVTRMPERFLGCFDHVLPKPIRLEQVIALLPS